MPAGPDNNTGKGSSQRKRPEGNPPRPAGGSYGDQQPQYGTTATDGQEPVPGRDEREDFGAGGEAFGSSSGQGRYGDDDQARPVEKPEHPAWQPFGQPDADHPEDSRDVDVGGQPDKPAPPKN
jgi:hypothetical protein